MTAENDNLRLQLSLVNSFKNHKKDKKSVARLRQLMLINNKIHNKIENERKKQIDLDFQVSF